MKKKIYFTNADVQEMKVNGFNYIEVPKAKKQTYICPSCGSGKGKEGHHTGMKFFKESHKYHCFVCGNTFDVFDYVGAEYGLTEFYDQKMKVAELMGKLEHDYIKSGNEKKKDNINISLLAKQEEKEKFLTLEEIAQKKEENKRNYVKWHNDLKSPQGVQALEYLHKRGIDDNLIDRFKIGLKWRKYIVLPVTTDCYITRPIDTKKYYVDSLEGLKPFRNYTYNQLNDYDIVLVCEGIFDALTVLRLGSFDKVISLNGANNTKGFYKIVEQCKSKNIMYVIQMDNDKAGEKAQQKICETLNNMKVSHANSSLLHILGDALKCKDINECYLKDAGKTTKYFSTYYHSLKILIKDRKSQLKRSQKQNEKQEIA